jgi:hypothetical protein
MSDSTDRLSYVAAFAATFPLANIRYFSHFYKLVAQMVCRTTAPLRASLGETFEYSKEGEIFFLGSLR